MHTGPRFEVKSTILLSTIAVLVTSLGFGGCTADGKNGNGQGRQRAKASPGPTVGIARDSDTGEAIERAWIFEAIPAGTLGADVERIAGIQTERSDDEGRFRFDPLPEKSGISLKRTYPPRYHFYHPSYGLVRGREAEGQPVEFTVSLRNAHLRQSDAAEFCTPAKRASATDGMALKLIELVCPPADPNLFSKGKQRRAEGEMDSQGRRDGAWTFYRKNGSVIAQGTYRAGAAIDPWSFYPPGQSPPEPSAD